jgi:hypothetical protein
MITFQIHIHTEYPGRFVQLLNEEKVGPPNPGGALGFIHVKEFPVPERYLDVQSSLEALNPEDAGKGKNHKFTHQQVEQAFWCFDISALNTNVKETLYAHNEITLNWDDFKKIMKLTRSNTTIESKDMLSGN